MTNMLPQYFYDSNVDFTSLKPHNTNQFLDAIHFFTPGRDTINDKFKKQIVSRLMEIYGIAPTDKEASDVLEKHYETIGTILVQTSKTILTKSNNAYQDLLATAFANNLHINFTALPQDQFKSVVIDKHVTKVKYFSGVPAVDTDSRTIESDTIRNNFAFSNRFNRQASTIFTKHLEFLKGFKRIVDNYTIHGEGLPDGLYPPMLSNSVMFGDSTPRYIEQIIEYKFNQEARELLNEKEYDSLQRKYPENDSAFSDAFKQLYVLKSFLKEERELNESIEEEDEDEKAFNERVNVALNAIKPLVKDHHVVINAMINERTSIPEDLYEVTMLKPILDKICNDAHLQFPPHAEKLVRALLKVLFFIEVIPNVRNIGSKIQKQGIYSDSSATRALTDSMADLIELLKDDDYFETEQCMYKISVSGKKQNVIEMLTKYIITLSTAFHGCKENRYWNEPYGDKIDEIIACLTNINDLHSTLMRMDKTSVMRLKIVNKLNDYDRGVTKKIDISEELANYSNSIQKLNDTYNKLKDEMSKLVELNSVFVNAQKSYTPSQDTNGNLSFSESTKAKFEKELTKLSELDEQKQEQRSFFGSTSDWYMNDKIFESIYDQCYNLWRDLTNALLNDVAINGPYGKVRLSQADITIAPNCNLSISVSDEYQFNNILLDVPVDGKIMHIAYKSKQTRADLGSFQIDEVAFQNFVEIGFDVPQNKSTKGYVLPSRRK